MNNKVVLENIVPLLKCVPLCPISNWNKYAYWALCLLPVQADLQSGCVELGICNPQLKDKDNSEGLQIPLFKAAGLQILLNEVCNGRRLVLKGLIEKGL